ncbi:uncharacterized protein LOC111389508 [Olea europaea var. sylvestris]|uniref:uncharacterized protein LOC111389508 n=1 Tax=Olea europaea var. sylvestris TaxID=158386 RepID=UPI000C1D5941|nr:uncharacterized protein LOC111389508 [Olea europaea var. sylvestris]
MSSHYKLTLCDLIFVHWMLGLIQSEVAVRLTYFLNSTSPPVRILSNNNVLTYSRLKSLDGTVSNYPIMVDVIAVDSYQSTCGLQCPDSSTTSIESSANVFSLQQIAQDTCDSIMMIEKGKIEEDVILVSQADAREVVEGKIFCNKEILKMSLVFYVIQNKFEYKVLRSDKKEYVIKCSHNDCKWIFRSSRLRKTKMFKIKKMCNGHTCSMNIVLRSYRQASSSIVSNCIKYKYTYSRTIYTHNDMLNKYGVSVNYMKAWRSREKTLKLIIGDPTTSFQSLSSYFFMLEQINIGTVTRIETDHLDRYKYYFMALGPLIVGWKYCRPVIIVDATYLNGHYEGTLFTACTQNANNNIFILTFGIGDNENDNS